MSDVNWYYDRFSPQWINAMTAETATETRYCWGCMRRQSKEAFKNSTRCRGCVNEASRLRMQKYRARKKAKLQRRAVSQFKIGSRDQTKDDVNKAAVALLKAFGGQEEFSQTVAEMLQSPDTPPEIRFQFVKVLLTCLEAIDK